LRAIERGIQQLADDRRTTRERLHGELVAAWRAESGPMQAQLRWRITGRSGAAAPTRPANAAPARGKPHKGPPVPHGFPFDPATDPRLAPALALARACDYEVAHCHHVTGLALQLFDQLQGTQHWEPQHRLWLASAGVLHDIGWVEGQVAHHKTALRIILESPLLPWHRRERQVIGTIARYHRGAFPRDDHDPFGSLSAEDRTAVRGLAALLRLADGLDYTHQGLVQELTCGLDAQRITIICTARTPAGEDIARGRQKSDLARAAFGREIDIRWRRPRRDPTDPS
jgi:exopolyphosphatase/guanosine-5'-triphosphate,3'-diphosphate pyrophosphatase